MKAFKKWAVVLTATAMLLFGAVGLAACGGDKGPNLADYVGTYKVETLRRQIALSDETYEVGASLKAPFGLSNEFGQDTLTDDYIVIVLNEDGTASVSSKISAELGGFQGEKTGTWTIDKDLFVTFEALSGNLTVRESSLSFQTNGKLRFWCMLGEANFVEYMLAK